MSEIDARNFKKNQNLHFCEQVSPTFPKANDSTKKYFKEVDSRDSREF